MSDDKIIILDGVGNEVRTYNVHDHGQACKEQGKTLRELAEGFCNKPDNQLRGFHIAGTKGGRMEITTEPVITEPKEITTEPEDAESELEALSFTDLKKEAKARNIEFTNKTKKDELIELIKAYEGVPPVPVDDLPTL